MVKTTFWHLTFLHVHPRLDSVNRSGYAVGWFPIALMIHPHGYYGYLLNGTLPVTLDPCNSNSTKYPVYVIVTIMVFVDVTILSLMDILL